MEEFPLTIPAEAPNAIKAVKKFAQKSMGVNDVRISPGLNQAVWSRGVKSPPRRIRVRLERKRNDDEGAKEKLYVVASVVEGITSFKVGLAGVSVEIRSVRGATGADIALGPADRCR